MKPDASTFIVRSTWSSWPCASCVKTCATSPKRAVPRRCSIGRYEAASRKVPARSTTNAPAGVSMSPPRASSSAAAMPLAASTVASAARAVAGIPARSTIRDAASPSPPAAVEPSTLGGCFLSRALTSSNVGVSTAPVSSSRKCGGSRTSAGSSETGQPTLAACSQGVSRSTARMSAPTPSSKAPGAYSASQSCSSIGNSAAAHTCAATLYVSPSAASVTHPRMRIVRSATPRWPRLASSEAASASSGLGARSRARRAGRLLHSVATLT
mmetsp:Transcript_84036/g.251922  ORF Transcript_84036/g.251922 Transcript_84036/m.251922 type:complete len:269 (+) Transcript_84036:809-1615(+)